MSDLTALVALRSEHASHEPEAELVTVRVEGPRVAFLLDDGSSLDLDVAELASALADAA
jgi:sarcosine oxidase gamma subunit